MIVLSERKTTGFIVLTQKKYKIFGFLLFLFNFFCKKFQMQLKIWFQWTNMMSPLLAFNLTVPLVISESYGKDMGLKSKDPIVFPYKMSALLNAMGMIWNFTLQNPIAIPQRMVQGHYRNGMGLLHTIPLMDTMGNIWNFTKYVGIPQRMFSHHMVSLWD